MKNYSNPCGNMLQLIVTCWKLKNGRLSIWDKYYRIDVHKFQTTTTSKYFSHYCYAFWGNLHKVELDIMFTFIYINLFYSSIMSLDGQMWIQIDLIMTWDCLCIKWQLQRATAGHCITISHKIIHSWLIVVKNDHITEEQIWILTHNCCKQTHAIYAWILYLLNEVHQWYITMQ